MLSLTIGPEERELLARLQIRVFGGKTARWYAVGDVVAVRPGSRIEAYSRHSAKTLIGMGAFSYASENGPAIVQLVAGRYCSIAVGLRVMDGHHPLQAVTTSPYIYGPYFTAENIPAEFLYEGPRPSFNQGYGPVVLGHDVWIGSFCTIRAGIRIGTGAVIAGGANVVKDVPDYAVVGGNPARIIRYRFPEEVQSRLLALRWWDISPRILRQCDMTDPEIFCSGLEDRIARESALERFAPGHVVVTRQGKLVEGKADPQIAGDAH